MRSTLALLAVFAAGVVAANVLQTAAASPSHTLKACTTTSAGYVQANLSWGVECLHAGEFCKIGNAEYHAYGFDCPASGHLTYGSSAATPPTSTPTTVVTTTVAAPTPTPPPTTIVTTTTSAPMPTPPPTTLVTTTTSTHTTPAAPALTTTSSITTTPTSGSACGANTVSANLPWGHRCLRAGESCRVRNKAYLPFGFSCPANGHLRRR